MKVTEKCVKCLYRKQQAMTDNEEYLEKVRDILENRDDDMCSPYMVYLFNKEYEAKVGKKRSFAEEKKKYNDLVLSMEDAIREKIHNSKDPLKKSLIYARIGNYIDFGAMHNVDEEKFLSLLEEEKQQIIDEIVYDSFIKQCAKAKEFLLIADNAGEIVLDKLFVEQLSKTFPNLKIKVLVRGAEVLNDVTRKDAEYVGIDRIANIYDNGLPLGGTVYSLLPEATKEAIDNADVILSKGQANFESLGGRGFHIFFSFLCKCELFTERFDVPLYTGMFIEEK